MFIMQKAQKYFDQADETRITLDLYIESCVNFVYLRFGDGEFANISLNHTNGRNCDGNKYIHQQGVELRNSLLYFLQKSINDRKIYIGIWTNHINDENSYLYKVTSDVDIDKSNIVYFNLINNLYNNKFNESVISSHIVKFYKTLCKCTRPKLYVANSDALPVAKFLNAEHAIIPLQNCYNDIGDILTKINDWISGNTNNPIVMFSSGLATEVMIYHLYQVHKNVTFIDIGTSLDILYKQSRDFHKWPGYVSTFKDLYGV